MRKIKCKLYNEPDCSLSAQQQILYNRGIPVEKQEEWLNAGWGDMISYKEMHDPALNKIIEIIHRCVENNESIIVNIDCDVDGYTSAAIFINFMYHHYPEYTESNIKWIHHQGKQHGLSDIMDEIIEASPSVAFCADSSSNDIEQHKILAEHNIECVILDHHEVSIDTKDSPACIVNIQENDYPNKNLTGAGVVFKFIEAYSDKYHLDSYWKELSDLAFIGDCGDMASYKDKEIRALTKIGCDNFKNPFLVGLANAHDYVVEKRNGLNYLSAAFSVCPWINATCRTGEMKEKQLVFAAMLEQNKDSIVPSSKRGHKGEPVSLVEEAILVAERIKRRQTDAQNEAMAYIEHQIDDNNLLDNAMLFLIDEEGKIDSGVRGLAANKAQAEYQHPTAVLTPVENEDGEIELRGSMRNYSLSVNQDLKSTLESTGLVRVAGHANAAGIFILEKDLNAVNKKLNEAYKDIDQTPVYWIDYSWTPRTVDTKRIIDIANLNIYGQNVPESFVEIYDIALHPSMIQLMGKNKDTIKITLPNGVAIMMFRQSEDLYNQMCEDNMVLDVCGKCNENIYNGISTPQVMCEEYTLKEEWIF